MILPCAKGNSASCLFVYGTLAPGESNHDLIEKIAGTWQEGSVVGVLHPSGRGPTTGYPVIDLERTGTPIKGFLFTSFELADHWAELDAFEGVGYRRVKTTVTVADGSETEAFLYALDHDSL